MVCHRSSTTSTRVSSPLVQTMKGHATRHRAAATVAACPLSHACASSGNSGSSRLCMTTWLECPTGRGRLANQQAAPSAHVGAVNDEARP
ncbi:hypothetical protein Tco_1503182 [Tanacetum coccineum]